jgi:guanosine-3',5'-bis(diphosphate) 3'-pyrophosphohydrolase
MFDQDLYLQAYRFAAEAHQRQTITGTELPYIVHCGLVSMEVAVALTAAPGYDGDLAVQCALLHDTLEDTAVTYAQLQARFGPKVAAGVLALTKDSTLPEAVQLADSLRRISQQPPEVWIVKLADRICNLQPPPAHWTKERIARYRAEALEIHQSLKDASNLLAERLLAKAEVYQQFQ